MVLIESFTSVRSWSKYYISGSLELLGNFVQHSEESALETAERYRDEVQIVEVEVHEDYTKAVEMHRGLDNESWDMRALFVEYFPNLQRRSALLTMSGLLESEVRMLCNSMKKRKNIQFPSTILMGRVSGKLPRI